MRCIKGYQPLCLLNDNIILYRKSRFVLYDKEKNSFQEIIRLKVGFIKKLKETSRLLSRIFRNDIRNALTINTDEFLYFSDRALYYASISEKKTQKLFDMRQGFSDPLCFSVSLRNSNFIAIFGEYGNNPNRQQVFIYGVSKDFSVHKMYAFPANTIRHIHNIIPDELQKGYYVLTGDNEKEAGIYWANKNFSIVKSILVGDQKYRAVSGFVTKKGFLYATDSVSKQNYIFLLQKISNKYLLKVIKKINGPCIYATEYSKGFVFSTTVETEENKSNKLFSFLSTKRGEGILSDKVYLVYVSRSLETKIIDVYQKDKLPYKLFKYGAVNFPTGMKNCNSLIAYPCAVKKFDGCTVIYK